MGSRPLSPGEQAERDRIARALDVLLELTASLLAQQAQQDQPPVQLTPEQRRAWAVVVAREQKAAA